MSYSFIYIERTDKNGFFTIGGSEISTANFKVPHEMVKFRSSFTVMNSLITNFLANKDIRAIGLLHDEKKVNAFTDFVLTKKQPFIKINDDIIKQLKEHSIDLVVYSRDKTCDKCALFPTIDFFFSKLPL